MLELVPRLGTIIRQKENPARRVMRTGGISRVWLIKFGLLSAALSRSALRPIATLLVMSWLDCLGDAVQPASCHASSLSRRFGLTRVPLPVLSRLALGKIAE